tara:strand:+ start:122 stop:796 length:675 start_codon:yes stop_codon:yes gene_type:complete
MHKILFVLLLIFVGCSGGDDDAETTSSTCSGIVDDCGVCNGYNHTMDCDGECDGTNILSDGCDIETSSTTAYFALGNDGTVYYRTPQAIAGFEFIVDGMSSDINLNMSGGAAEDNNIDQLTCQHNSDGYLCMGFSFSGATIPVGCGVLVNLSFGICTGADSDGDGTPDSTQPTNEATCLDPANGDTDVPGTWTASTLKPYTTISNIVNSSATATAIVTEAYCNY